MIGFLYTIDILGISGDIMLFQRSKGFSLLELMITVAIVGILASIAYPSYQAYIDRVDEEIAISEITLISGKLDSFFIVHGNYPTDLLNIGLPADVLMDSWGNAYEYLDISTVTGKGKLRKNKSLVPINTDYDLYSKGKDTKSVGPLTSALSQDDIVRGRNGAYIGLGKDYH